jgi:hypothetical protein
MKTLTALGIASAAAMIAVAPASARQGCGPGFHRSYNGMCRPNRDNMQVQFVEGRYYHGRGYWWHNGWHHRRYRRNGVWIYL